MSSHILMATMAGIALSTPAWAHDPAKAPFDMEVRAILLDPAEAPIDTEMKIILLVENLQAALRENTAGGRAAARSGPTIAEHQPAAAPTNVATE